MSALCYCGHPFHEPDCEACPRASAGRCYEYRPFMLGFWKHYKSGKLYKATGLRRHSENPSVVLVDYENESGEKWSRPLFTPPWDAGKKEYGWLDPVDRGTPDERPRFLFVQEA